MMRISLDYVFPLRFNNFNSACSSWDIKMQYNPSSPLKINNPEKIGNTGNQGINNTKSAQPL
jgi:hypothetical protein